MLSVNDFKLLSFLCNNVRYEKWVCVLKKVLIGKKSVLICIAAYLLYNNVTVDYFYSTWGGGGGDYILSCNMYCSIGMFLTGDITIMAPVTG